MFFVDNNIGGHGFLGINDVTITGNTCHVVTANISGNGLWSALNTAAHQRWTVTGNLFSGYAGGIRVDATTKFDIESNVLQAFSAAGTGILIGATPGPGVVSGNIINTYTTPLASSGSALVIRDNPGYNPVGASSVTPGASPWTYTASASPETHYIPAGTISSMPTAAQ